jgi:hypothetical protein
VYALGCILYQMLSGKPPFFAMSEGELLTMHLRDEPPPLQVRAPEVGEKVAQLVHGMLRKDQNDRPTMQEAEDELRRLSGLPPISPDVSLSDVLRNEPYRPAHKEDPRRRPFLPVAVGLLLGALISVGGLVRWPHLLPAGGPRHPWGIVPSGTKFHLRTVFLLDPGNVWAAGDSGTILHYNGKSWIGVPSGTTQSIRGIWGSGPSDLWAAGGQGTILHWNGTAWTGQPGVPTIDIRGIWGSGPKDVWTAGKQGFILHYDGQNFTQVPTGVSEDLRSIWGPGGAAEVWAVGEYGLILHWDGTAWSKMDSGTTSWLANVWGSGPHDVWAVGNESTLLHFDGKRWTGVYSATRNWIYGISGSGPADAWAVGGYGTLLRYRPGG